jgi:hypothetical protein
MMISRSNRTAMAAAALGLLMIGLLSACEAETASGTTPPAPRERPVAAPGPTTTHVSGVPAPLPPGHVRVTGMVFSTSDDQATPQRPFERGRVLAVPMDWFMAFQSGLNHPLVVGQYVHRSFAVPRRLPPGGGADACDLKPDGTYMLTLRPGKYAFCLAELGGVRPEGTDPDALWVESWAEVTIHGEEEELQTVVPVYNRASGKVTILR